MRWLIIEDALRDRKGHWFEYITAFHDGLQALGDEVEILADRRAEPEVVARLGAQPVLPESIWRRMSDGSGALKRYARVPLHALATRQAVARWIAQHQYPDIIFVPTVLVHHLLGWTWLIKGPLRQSRTRVLLFFPNTPVRTNPRSGAPEWIPAPTSLLFRRLVHSLRVDRFLGRVVFGAETRPMCDALSRLTDVPFTYFPHPVASPVVSAPDMKAVGQPIVMGSYGSARHEKGSDLLAAAVLAYCRDHPQAPVQFELQCVEGRDQDWKPLRGEPRVRLIPGYFAEGEYARRLRETQLLLLPYRRASYDLRVSRVAIEAMTAGLPAVVTRGTTLDAQTREFGAAELFDDGNIPSLVDAIGRAEANYPDLRSTAANRAGLARRHFSVHNFRELLQGTPDPSGGGG